MRFKIDFYNGSSFPFGLYVQYPARGWIPRRWECIDHFATKDEAKALYEKIKDLPEYLP